MTSILLEHYELESSMPRQYMESSIRSQTSFVYQVAPKDLVCIKLEDPDRTYFPGERIIGHVQIGMKHGSNSRVAIHLACTAKLGTRTLPLFKIPLQPTPLTPQVTNIRIPFNILVPGDVPSSVDHSRVPGKIEYKVKAVHELNDLPSCVWPKASAVIKVHERISAIEEKYKKGMTSEGQLSFHIPHDITLKHCSFRKGEHKTASAWLHIPRSCYLPDETVPFTLRVKHFAPIRQMDGVTAYLERITKTVCDMENSIDTIIIAHCTFPLACDADDYQCKFTSNKLKIPQDTPPTLESDQYPLQVSYRVRIVVSLDMDGLPLRKRDKMATYMGMIKMKFNEEESAGGSTIVLDIPIKVGTSDEDLPSSLRSVPSFKSLFDGGFGFFQQDERGMVPPSPMLGPPPAYNVAINSNNNNDISINSTNNNHTHIVPPPTTPSSTIVTLRQLTSSYESTVDSTTAVSQQQRFINTDDKKQSPSMLLSSSLQPPPSLLILEGLIPRQPSAPNLQDLESPIPISRSTLQHRYSDNMIPDNTFAAKPSIHARSWSVPADKHNPKYSPSPFAHQSHHQQHQQQLPVRSQTQPQPPLPPAVPPQLPPQYLYHNPPPVPTHHHLYHLPQQQHHNPRRHSGEKFVKK
ncbi:hypothetical protein BDA99DRAFT_602869 [Phascolomyces articulosus]|uniref:Arrestin C-terminal-like domain-containing protein n=1 Tax=Phascolomyces articulosus TaxID=60185 RepID=A0AAD5KLL1_9FUNG|nr:hypothetical protein BDA99DRAFT_602869 [Phascolomyces articulosus]